MRYQTKARIAIVIGLVVSWDVSTFIADQYASERDTLLARVDSLEHEISQTNRSREEERELYRDKLMEIVEVLYSRDQINMGGYGNDQGREVTAIYEAIMNSSRDYRGLLLQVENYFEHRGEFLSTVPNIWPVRYNELTRITSGFGSRLSPITGTISFHAAIDIASEWNAPVIAPADGVVLENWPAPDGYYQGHPKLGGMLVIQHGNGFVTRYGHMRRTLVSGGDVVEQGDEIGRIGNTGLSRGPHLHYEVWKDGVPVNPLDYLRF